MEHVERFEASLTDEGRYRILVEGITDYAIYMLDPQGNIASWNPGAQRFKGYTTKEILGQNFSRFYTDEDRAAGLPQRALAEAASKGKFESEGWRVRKDGTRFWAYVVIDPIRDTKGNILGYGKITRDLTERRNAERALEQAREALFQAQKMEAVGRLTGGIAHDFNNLLMVILGSLELLRKRMPDDPKLMALLENAFQGAQRGASLTQRMLAFARRQQLDLEAVDIRALVNGMSDLLQRSLGPEIVIETRFSLSLAPVRTDANQLESALLNLAVNARDAMPEGGTIIIAAREEYVASDTHNDLMPGPYVCLSIQDTGEGMDAETLAQAAEPFFTTKGPGKGTGLGLSMVHGLATQSGGNLRMRSEPGLGTTVEIWLPATTPHETEATPDAGVIILTARPLRIMVVDDDPLVLINTIAMLEDMKHTVIHAPSGQQALDMLRTGDAVDLVITDHAMPGMTGVQLTQAIAKTRPDLPVIIATGYAELPSGMGGNLPKLLKPFSQLQLAQAIAETIHAAHNRQKTES